jgi:hypothetical protein
LYKLLGINVILYIFLPGLNLSFCIFLLSSCDWLVISMWPFSTGIWKQYWFCIPRLCRILLLVPMVFCQSLRFPVYKVMSSTHTDYLSWSSHIWMTFISFSCPISLVRTSQFMLNKVWEWASLACSRYLRETFSISKSNIQAVGIL